MNINTLTFDTIGSTNTEALEQARRGADEGLCIVARQQTAGRGRLGRTWVSEKDSGLYYSLLLRPRLETRLLPLVTLMAGVAVHETLAELGIDADVKWVNDLHVGGRKICGILAETSDTPKGIAVVVGIGINIRSTNFPPHIADTATSIEAETNAAPAVGELAERVSRHLIRFYKVLNSADGPALIRREWQQRSTYFSGKEVSVALDNETFEGTTDGLEENGALRVVLADGSVRIVQAGDVRRLRRT